MKICYRYQNNLEQVEEIMNEGFIKLLLRPLAANVSSNIPIVLRTAAVTEQVKTLKCNECGAMNYPTEWYCERCGAELAAL